MSMPGFTAEDLMTMEATKTPPLIAPWLDERGLAMIHAAPAVGKSMLAMTLALAVAGGGRVLGWEVPKARKVLYIDAEMTLARMAERVKVLRSSVDGVSDESRANLRIIGKQFYDETDESGLPVAFPEIGDGVGAGADTLIQWVRESGAELVVLDNLSQLAAMTDENDSAGARRLTAFTARIRAAGAAVLWVHHDSKAGRGSESGFRGSSGLNDPLDVRIGLSRASHPNGCGAAFKVNFWKMRHLMPELANHAEAWLEEDGQGGHRWCSSSEDRMPGAVETLLEAARSGCYASQKAMAEALGWNQSKVTDTLKLAVDGGYVTKPGFKALRESEAAEVEALAAC